MKLIIDFMVSFILNYVEVFNFEIEKEPWELSIIANCGHCMAQCKGSVRKSQTLNPLCHNRTNSYCIAQISILK